MHEGERWEESVIRKNDGDRTAATSEAYGEATLATAGRMIRLLANLTRYVPAMRGWEGQWDLDAGARFLDIGSGYGKVVFHAKLLTSCRAAVGYECVPKRDEIANISLQGLFSELDRASVDDDILRGISFDCVDAAQLPRYEQSHIYPYP